MLAAVYHGKNDVRLERLPIPKISAREILVRVGFCGVCPTDLKKIHSGTLEGSRVFGHETAGTIVKVGSAVTQFIPGDRVALHHHVPCLKCHACKHKCFAQCPVYKKTGITAGFEPSGGGFAEYVRVKEFVLPGVVKIPERNFLLEGTMLEPVNTVLKGVHKLGLLPGDRVLVVGQGPIGLLFTALCRILGFLPTVTDLLDERLRLAKTFGAQGAFNPAIQGVEEIMKKTKGAFDAVVLAVPSNTAVAEYWPFLRGGGKFLLFAHTLRGVECPIDLGSVCVDEKDLVGSYSSDFQLQSRVARLVFSRKLDVRPLLKNLFPLTRIQEALDLASNPSPKSLKIIIEMEEPPRLS